MTPTEIARIIRSIGEDGALCMDDPCDRVRLAMEFASVFLNTNPLFDTDTFMTAATLPGDLEVYDETAMDA